MARLPIPGSDKNTWGDVLNDFLSQAHQSNGLLKPNSVNSTTIAPNTVTNAQLQDGVVTASKLSTAVQAAIDEAIDEVDLDKEWVIAGPINVAALDVDYIVPAYLGIPSGYTAAITTVRARINSGTNVNLKITQNGSTLAGLGSLVVVPAGVTVTGLSLAVSDGDLIAPVVNSTSGSPQNMTVMVGYKTTKT
jgi:hypothetical protein